MIPVGLRYMANKEYLENAESNRVREEARALIEEARRRRLERPVHQTVGGVYEWTTRPNVPTPWGTYILCGSEDNREEAESYPDVVAREIEEARLLGIRIRLTGTTPYYIKQL